MGFFASSGILNRRGFFGGAFSPLNIPNLGLWLDATNVGVPIAPGNPVSQWNDQSGNGGNVTQAVPSRRPTYLANNINGLPAISFDGVRNFLTRPAFLWSAGASSVFTVLKGNPASNGDKFAIVERGYSSFENFGNSIYAPVFSNVPAGSPYFSTRVMIDADPSFIPPFFGSWDNQYKLFSVIDSGTVINGYVNGVLGGTQNYSRVQPGFAPFTDFSIGAAYVVDSDSPQTFLSGPFAGIFAEIIIYTRALNDTERLQVEDYLRNKWLRIYVLDAIQGGITVSTSLFGSINCDPYDGYFAGFRQIFLPAGDSAFDEINLSYNSSTGLWTLAEFRNSENTDLLPNFSRTSTVAGTADYIPMTGWPEGVFVHSP